jgi:peroxiredoxin
MSLVPPGSATAARWRRWLPVPPHLGLPLGQIPPDFALWDVTYQRTVRLANWRGKQPLVMVFCRLGPELVYSPDRYGYLIALSGAYHRFRNGGVEVLLVVPAVRRQAEALGADLSLELPLLCDETGATFRAYATGQALGGPLPAQFVLDAQGRLRYRHVFSLLHPQADLDRLLAVATAL